LTPIVSDDVNFVNAQVLAKDRGIKVTEATQAMVEDYSNLITVRIVTADGESIVSGTVFGKNDTRIVVINNFRLEMIPDGHLALIQNRDIPGSIGEIGTKLGQFGINISRMHVGQEEDGQRNIIFLQLDTALTEEMVAGLNSLETVKRVTPLEF
jgi:D-3-phosphoglycerate dehydrogenase